MFLAVFYGILYVITKLFIRPNQNQVQDENAAYREHKKKLAQIAKGLSKLKATADNFDPLIDVCCICIEKLDVDRNVIFLPCHERH